MTQPRCFNTKLHINVDHKGPSTRLIGASHQHQYCCVPGSGNAAQQVLESKPSTTFWAALVRCFDRFDLPATNAEFRVSKASAPLPRFFSKIVVHTDTVYTQDRQRNCSRSSWLSLRMLLTFEALYLSRTSNKMNESVGQAFQGGARTPPSSPEGMNVARTIANELNLTHCFLDLLLTRTDGLVIRGQTATLLTGPAAMPEHSSDVYVIMRSSVIDTMGIYGRITGPILTAIKSESSAVIAKLHRESVRSADPLSNVGGSSAYVKELTEELSFVKSEVLARLSTEDVTREWPLDIVRHVLRTFVLHVLIVKPLDAAGSEYRALRALRPLLFLETSHPAGPGGTAPAGGAVPHTHARFDPAAAYAARVTGGRVRALGRGTLGGGGGHAHRWGPHALGEDERDGRRRSGGDVSVLARDVLANARAKQSD
ncbi:hypothetical protein BJV78DRAFT_1155322 [Lactifluus subvellereus]|nr:hypothetical protein BJV78DRAFT_1155322 [Lactifluus subvellereus]